MAVLVRLAERPGEVVTRTELLDAVWGGTVVQEEALTQAVSQLRRALDDDSRAQAIIETIPKQGYRLAAPVTPLAADIDMAGDETAPPPGDVATPAARRGRRRTWLAAIALVAVAAALGALLLRGMAPGGGGAVTQAAAPGGWQERPLTSLPGEEGWPALSPDGQLVAFAGREPGGPAFRLRLLRLATGETFPLTDEPGDQTQPSWSPDGERIAFALQADTGSRLCIVAAIGGPVQALGPEHWALGGHDWSADGKTIIYSAKDRQEEPMRLRRLRVADGGAAVVSDPEPLSRGDTWPRFSPDGASLAFIRSDRGSTRDVMVMPADGDDRGARRAAGGFSATGGLAWDAGGKSLVVSATWRGTYELWRVPVAGGEPALLPAKGHRLLHPDCGRSEGPLVFVEVLLDTELEIHRLEAPGEAPAAAPVAAASSTRLDTEGRFSPDGASIVFVSERSGARELWLLDRASGDVRRLTSLAGDALRKPRWSPDGKRIAANVTREGRLQVVVVDVATGLQRQVTPGGGHFRLGHWSADGQWLFYSRERGAEWQVGRVRVDGTGAADVDCAGCLSLHEQPDGTLTYFKETEPGLFRRRAGGAEARLAVPEDDGATTDNVEVTADGAWFTRTVGGVTRLSFRPFDGGPARDVARLPDNATGEFDISADGRELLLSTVARSGADLVMVGDPSASAEKRQPR